MARKKNKKEVVKKKGKREKILFFVLLLIIVFLTGLNVAKAAGWLVPEIPNIEVINGTIDLNSLTLEQKVAQMVIVGGSGQKIRTWKELQVGGFHLFARETEKLFRDQIWKYQEGRTVPFFITVDLEGCISPFLNFKRFVAAAETDNLIAAFQKGLTEGDYLRELGFNFNFAPVVELGDEIWNCRAFPGNVSQITELAQAYALGLEAKGIMATIKHYPGKTLVVRDPHKFLVAASISREDLYPYNFFFNEGEVGAVMVSHVIASGEVNSEGVPAVVSKQIMEEIRERFEGLIVSDEINMLGLKNFYSSLDEMYVEVFKAGNDLVLNFNDDPNEISRMIKIVVEAVQKGEIEEERIDRSVTKILEAKGFRVV